MLLFCFQVEDCTLHFGVHTVLHSPCPHNVDHSQHGHVMSIAPKTITVQKLMGIDNCFQNY